MKAEAFLFDVFGTLVNWRDSIAREAAVWFQQKDISVDPYEFADYWRACYQPAMERIRSGQRAYVSLDVLHLENLHQGLKHFQIAGRFSDPDCIRFNTAWERLNSWEDVVAGLTALKTTAIIAPCSNGSIALTTRLAKYARLPWDCVLGADIARAYKPDPNVYHACCDALRLKPFQVVMVAAHNSDLAAASACGLQTAFIARPTEYGPDQAEDLIPNGDWDGVITNIGELAK